MAEIIKVKVNDQWISVPAMQGEKGLKGDKGDKGDPGSSEWGLIEGTITNQTDLMAKLNEKGTKVTTISTSSTDAEYPSAKCVYDIVGDIEEALKTIRGV